MSLLVASSDIMNKKQMQQEGRLQHRSHEWDLVERAARHKLMVAV